ncbi:BSD domain containing protein [Gracilaria domingensis]|nr:BSD domain containing protein [Gracilaria domingensis]
MMASTEEPPSQVPPEVQESPTSNDVLVKSETSGAPSPTDVSAQQTLSQETSPSELPNKELASDSGENLKTEGEPEKGSVQQTQEITFDDIRAAADQIDENIDNALGHAADTLWSFASSVRGTMSSVVNDESGLAGLRKNVTSHLAPLDDIGRGIQSQIGAFAPKDVTLANITGSMRSVAESVQRNAQAVEEAIIAKANEPSAPKQEAEPDQAQKREAASILAGADAGMDILSVIPSGEGIEVNQDIAKVGEKVSEKVGGLSHAIGETVGGFLTGLLGDENDELYDEIARRAASKVPKTRFEKRIYELQANPETYCKQPDDMELFNEWGKDFNLEEYAESCIEILYMHETIADLYERMVPNIIEEDTFWMRYFFARDVLHQEEGRRRKLLEQADTAEAQDGNEDEGWGDDDWGEDDIQGSEAPESQTPANKPEDDTVKSKKEPLGEGSEKDEGESKQDDKTMDPSESSNSKPSPTDLAKKMEQVKDAEEDDDWGVDDWE